MESDSPRHSVNYLPITRTTGAADAERFLQTLCERSFLRLWSYVGAFRKGGGKEVADLLVVFGNDMDIFADKACGFPDGPNIELDWSLWYRTTIAGNIIQAWVQSDNPWFGRNLGSVQYPP